MLSAIDATAERLDGLGRRAPVVPLAVGVLLYSIGPVFVQASSVSGAVFSFWRLWFGVAAFGIATVVNARVTGGWPSRRAWRWALGAGVAFGLHQLLLSIAIKATTVADVTLVTTLSPVVTALLALPFFAERPGPRFRLWSLVAMGGAAIVVVGASTSPQGDLGGMLLALANVVAFAGFFLLSKASRGELAVIPFLFGVMTAAAVVVTGYVTISGEDVTTATSTDLLYTAIVALGPGAFGHAIMTWPLAWVPANVPPVMRLGQPVLAALWAWWFLSEPITVWHLTGGAVTIAGVAGAVLSRSGRRFISEEASRGSRHGRVDDATRVDPSCRTEPGGRRARPAAWSVRTPGRGRPAGTRGVQRGEGDVPGGRVRDDIDDIDDFEVLRRGRRRLRRGRPGRLQRGWGVNRGAHRGLHER